MKRILNLKFNSPVFYKSMIPFLILLFSFLPGTGKAYPEIGLQFAIPAMQSGLDRIQRWQPIMEYLEEACGFEIELVIEKDHESVVQGLQNKYYDAALLNALYETKALLLKGIVSKLRLQISGGQSYSSCLIVPESSVIRTPAALGGQYLALTVPNESLGGYYVPLVLLSDHGLDPRRQYRQIIYSETYESILKGVAYGLLDTGAVTSHVLMDENNISYRDKVRIILESEEIPQPAIVVQVNVRERMIEKLIAEMMQMHRDTEGITILAMAGIDLFASVEEKHLQIQPEILRKIEKLDALAR